MITVDEMNYDKFRILNYLQDNGSATIEELIEHIWRIPRVVRDPMSETVPEGWNDWKLARNRMHRRMKILEKEGRIVLSERRKGGIAVWRLTDGE